MEISDVAPEGRREGVGVLTLPHVSDASVKCLGRKKNYISIR